MKTVQTNFNVIVLRLALTALIAGILALSSCDNKKENKVPIPVKEQMVTKSTLKNIRLADGIGLNIEMSTRWMIEDKVKFENLFVSKNNYDSLILMPKQHELANNVSNQYDNVDSVFTSQKHEFIKHMKDYITENLGESGVKINEIIISKVEFPYAYTVAKEKLALQDQELKRIRKQIQINLENAEANRKQAIAQGAVDIEKAQMDSKVQKINAETEKSRRLSTLARAETDKQVAEKRAESDAKRQVLLNKADLAKRKDLKDLEIQKQRELNVVAAEKIIKLDEARFTSDMKMAELCNSNPVYANYMINKELASKVKIAVLPSGQNAGDFTSLLNMDTNKK